MNTCLIAFFGYLVMKKQAFYVSSFISSSVKPVACIICDVGMPNEDSFLR